MLNIILILVLVSALLNAFLFGGQPVYSVLAAVLALGLLIAKTLFSRKLPGKIITGIVCAGLAVLFVLGLASGTSWGQGTMVSLTQDLEVLDAQLADGNLNKAEKTLRDMYKTYGDSDLIRLKEAALFLSKGDIDNALQVSNSVGDKSAPEYYLVMGKTYYKAKDYVNAYKYFSQGALAYPDWPEIQFLAGSMAFYNRAYKEAEYFLLRAQSLDETNPIGTYYLGVIRYQQKAYEEAKAYFTHTLANKPGPETKDNALWYLEQIAEMGGTGK